MDHFYIDYCVQKEKERATKTLERAIQYITPELKKCVLAQLPTFMDQRTNKKTGTYKPYLVHGDIVDASLNFVLAKDGREYNRNHYLLHQSFIDQYRTLYHVPLDLTEKDYFDIGVVFLMTKFADVMAEYCSRPPFAK